MDKNPIVEYYFILMFLFSEVQWTEILLWNSAALRIRGQTLPCQVSSASTVVPFFLKDRSHNAITTASIVIAKNGLYMNQQKR